MIMRDSEAPCFLVFGEDEANGQQNMATCSVRQG